MMLVFFICCMILCLLGSVWISWWIGFNFTEFRVYKYLVGDFIVLAIICKILNI